MADSIDVVPIGAYYGKAGTDSCSAIWSGSDHQLNKKAVKNHVFRTCFRESVLVHMGPTCWRSMTKRQDLRKQTLLHSSHFCLSGISEQVRSSCLKLQGLLASVFPRVFLGVVALCRSHDMSMIPLFHPHFKSCCHHMSLIAERRVPDRLQSWHWILRRGSQFQKNAGGFKFQFHSS